MATIQNKVIHRFIRSIDEYEEGGLYYNRVIPLDTQAYAYYPVENPDSTSFANVSDSTSIYKTGLYYVLGDGDHTYTEIRDGKGNVPSAKEYPVFTQNLFDDKIDTLIAGSNVVISGEGSFRKISVPGVAVPDKFTSDQELPEELFIGDELQNLDGTRAFAIKPPASLKENDIIYFANQFQLLVTYVDPSETLYDAVVIFAPNKEDVLSFENIKGNPEDNTALALALDDKLEKKNLPNTIYGIDKSGNQTLFHFLDVGIPDAPKDSNRYVRKDGAWVKLNPAEVINDNTISKTTTYSSSRLESKFKEIINSIQDINVLNVEVVDELPEEGVAKTLFLVSNNKSEEKNTYDEYMWINGKWELIGNRDIDLTEYAKESKVEEIKTELSQDIEKNSQSIALKQDILTAGKNIVIENNVISSLCEITSINKKLPDENGNVEITKEDVGLGAVDNTSDLDKPISKATLYVLDELQNAVDKKQDILIAGKNISIEGNVISSIDPITSYETLTEKPSINGIELLGNKTFEELGIQTSGDFATNDRVNTVENTLREEIEKKADKINTEAALSKVQSDISTLDENKADKATTLFGYGINDAYTKLWIDTHFVNTERYNSDIDRNNALLANLDEIKASKDELNSGLSKKQDTLIAGEHISIKENVISTNYLYTDLIDKPSINNVVLEGNKTPEDLGLQATLKAGNGIILENDVISVVNNIDSYDDLIDKPYINGTELKGALTLDDLGIQQKGEYVSAKELEAETERALEAEELLNNSVASISRDVGYATQAISYLESEKQDRLIPGYGIRITGNVISVDLSDREESDYDDSGYDESSYIPINPGIGYVTRVEYEAKCNEYEDKIAALEQRLDRMVKLVTSAGFMIVGVDEAVDF